MADDAVVVLVTKMPDDPNSYEHRVAYVSNIENLYGIFDPATGKWSGDSGIILDLFAENDIYTDLDMAIDYAQSLITDKNTPEFGIMIMKDFENKYFYDL